MQLAEADLSRIIEDAVAVARGEFERANRSLTFHSEGPIDGKWDKARVEQILDQLLSNALRYGLREPVAVAVASDGEVARIEVRDDGIGIDPGLHESIFDPFERGVSWRHYGGLGLGLWICRKIIEALGGTIRAKSDPGDGATFIVELPLEGTIVGAAPTCPV